MRVTKTIKPGQSGSQRFVRRYGKRLVNVRYREDRETRSIYTTVELIIDQREWMPNVNQSSVYAQQNTEWVAVSIPFHEIELRNTAKSLGARWSQEKKVWVMLYKNAAQAGLLDRVIPNLAAKVRDVDLYA